MINRIKILVYALISGAVILLSSCSDDNSVNTPVGIDTNDIKIKIGQQLLIHKRMFTGQTPKQNLRQTKKKNENY